VTTGCRPWTRPCAPAPGPPPAPAPPGASARGLAAALAGATGWLNSPPLTEPDLRGRVVLVDFCTYTCINWLRTLPYVRAWRERYAVHGLLLIGVHTPEFDFEGDVDNVRRAVEDLRVAHPIAVDTDRCIWRAFGNRYRPALYLVDGRGRVRYHHVGDGDHERSERAVQHLLTEAGARGAVREPVAVDATGIGAPADRTTCGPPRPTWATTAPRTSSRAPARSSTSGTCTRCRRRCRSTAGRCRGTGRSGGRPPC
jgi:hypothetical protein